LPEKDGTFPSTFYHFLPLNNNLRGSESQEKYFYFYIMYIISGVTTICCLLDSGFSK
jgi:hypothetical protein